MRCVQCGSLEDKVIDSRTSKDGFAIRRRRECISCNHRFTTYEQLEEATLLVVKNSGIREPFDRNKLLSGMIKACEKRRVGLHQLETAVDAITSAVREEGLKEVPTSILGPKVMEQLRDIDPVGYVRYASVYRQFEEVGEFIEEIESLEKRPYTDLLQPDLFPQ